VTYSTLGSGSGNPPTQEEYANLVAALKSVAKRATEYRMTLGVEPCNRYETHLFNTAELALRVICQIGESNLTIHLDSYHMNIEEQGPAAGFKTAGRATNYVDRGPRQLGAQTDLAG
jgi:D-psicose/D-tagatose/L-ribulose 3-epimerase